MNIQLCLPLRQFNKFELLIHLLNLAYILDKFLPEVISAIAKVVFSS